MPKNPAYICMGICISIKLLVIVKNILKLKLPPVLIKDNLKYCILVLDKLLWKLFP